jgi:hypothetical protein
MLDTAILKDVAGKMVTPDVRQAAVAHVCAVHGVSPRRACATLAVDRSTARYVARRGDDAELRLRSVRSQASGAGSAIGASRDCQEFRVWTSIVGSKEITHGVT